MSGLASMVDTDLSTFRALQSQISNLRQTQQTLMQQQNENDMVKAEVRVLLLSFRERASSRLGTNVAF